MCPSISTYFLKLVVWHPVIHDNRKHLTLTLDMPMWGLKCSVQSFDTKMCAIFDFTTCDGTKTQRTVY